MAVLNTLKKLAFLGLVTGMTFCSNLSGGEEINGMATNFPPKIIRNLSPSNREREIRPYTKYIVLHTTEASDGSSINSIKNDGSAHYVIKTNGDIHSIVLDDKVANHAGESMWNGDNQLNYYSIGVEIVGYFDREINCEQYASSRDLVKFLQEKYQIRDEDILVHAAVAYQGASGPFSRPYRGRKIDGINIDMEKLGISRRPLYDPDVREGRLAANKDLEKTLYPSMRNNLSGKKSKPLEAKFSRKVIKISKSSE